MELPGTTKSLRIFISVSDPGPPLQWPPADCSTLAAVNSEVHQLAELT